jgi:hypothetical protein
VGDFVENNRCNWIKKDGERCKVPAFKSDPEGFCLFHSHSPEASEIKRVGRLSGAHALKKKQSRDLVFGKISTTSDLLNFMNEVRKNFCTKQISLERLRGYSMIGDNFNRILQNKKVTDKIDDLEKEIALLKEVRNL